MPSHICLIMCRVSGAVGQFVTGSPSSEGQMSGDSRPQNTPVIAIAEPGDSQVNGLFPLEQTVTSLSIT